MLTPENSQRSIQITLNAPGNMPNATLCTCLERCFPSLRATWLRYCGETKPEQTSTTFFQLLRSVYSLQPPSPHPPPQYSYPPHYSPPGPPRRVLKISTEAWSSQQPMTWSKKVGRMNLEMMLKQLLKRYVKFYSWQSYSYTTAYFSVCLTVYLFRVQQ